MYQSAKNLIVGVISAAITLGASLTHAGHHEQLQPPAKPGQVVVVYQGACPAKSVDAAIDQVKKVIAYERANSPVRYSSSPGVWADGKVGAVDIHDSMASMKQAFAWQASDATWSAGYDAVAASCGITVEDFSVSILEAR